MLLLHNSILTRSAYLINQSCWSDQLINQAAIQSQLDSVSGLLIHSVSQADEAVLHRSVAVASSMNWLQFSCKVSSSTAQAGAGTAWYNLYIHKIESLLTEWFGLVIQIKTSLNLIMSWCWDPVTMHVWWSCDCVMTKFLLLEACSWDSKCCW